MGPLQEACTQLPKPIQGGLFFFMGFIWIEYISLPDSLSKVLERPFVVKSLKNTHLHVLSTLFMEMIEEEKIRVQSYQRLLERLQEEDSEESHETEKLILVI